jgi:hypothetical protein
VGTGTDISGLCANRDFGPTFLRFDTMAPGGLMPSNRKRQVLGLILMAVVGVAFGIWLLRAGFLVLGCFWVGVFLWRGQQFVVWFLAPVKAPSGVTPPLTSTWQRLLLSIVCLLGAAVCAAGIYLWRLWPEQWQAGLVFVLFGLLVLAPVTIKEIQSRRRPLAQSSTPD